MSFGRRVLSPASLAPLLLLGCGGANPWDDPAPGAVLDEVIEAPLDEVWQALPRVYRALGLPPAGEVDSASHLLTTTDHGWVERSLVGPRSDPVARCSVPSSVRISGNSAWLRFDEATGPVTLTARTQLQNLDGRTRLRVELIASGASLTIPGGASGVLEANCVTTGSLETRLVEALRVATVPGYEPSDPASADPSDQGRSPF